LSTLSRRDAIREHGRLLKERVAELKRSGSYPKAVEDLGGEDVIVQLCSDGAPCVSTVEARRVYLALGLNGESFNRVQILHVRFRLQENHTPRRGHKQPYVRRRPGVIPVRPCRHN
jgi:hypothetical protein